MNKGESFELRVYEAIKTALSEGKLGLIADFCRVYHQKGYYSKDRKGYIRSDVSVELCLKEGLGPTIIWVWECKDHSRKVSVRDVEEFHAKLDQIGADKTKGTIICSGKGFQNAAWEYAESKGIGLGRLRPSEKEIESELQSQGLVFLLIIPLMLMFAILFAREVIQFLRYRNGRSWSEYKYQQAYLKLRKAHCDPTFVLEEGDFYGLSTCRSGRASRKRITRDIKTYIEVEINHVQSLFESGQLLSSLSDEEWPEIIGDGDGE